MPEINVPQGKVDKIELGLARWKAWQNWRFDRMLEEPNITQERVNQIEADRADVNAYTWTTWTWKVFSENALALVKQGEDEMALWNAREAKKTRDTTLAGELGGL